MADDTLELETKVPNSETGMTFVRGERYSVLKHPDGGVKKVPERFVDDLIRVSRDEAKIDEFPADFSDAIDQLREEGYIYRGPTVELHQPPFSVLPYACLAGLLLLPYLFIVALEVDVLFAVVSSTSERPTLWFFLYGAALILPTVAIHEWGHFREAGKYVPVGFGVGTVNGLVPVYKTYTTEAWLLSRQHRMWVNLAGITYQSLALLPLVGIYFLDLTLPLPGFEEALPWLLITYFVGSLTFTLNPIYHGDGYLIVTDYLGEYNIRKRAKRAFESRTFDLYGIYGFISYGLVNLYIIASAGVTLAVWGWIVGGILVGGHVLFVAIEFSGSRARRFISREPDWADDIRGQIEYC